MHLLHHLQADWLISFLNLLHILTVEYKASGFSSRRRESPTPQSVIPKDSQSSRTDQAKMTAHVKGRKVPWPRAALPAMGWPCRLAVFTGC